MIDKALEFIVSELNEYLDLKMGERPVKLTKLSDDPETGESSLNNLSVGCSLVNIEEDRVAMNHNPYSPSVGGIGSRTNPEIYLNVYLVFAVNPDNDNYADGIRMLSYRNIIFSGEKRVQREQFTRVKF